MNLSRPVPVLVVLALGAGNAACVRAPTFNMASPFATGNVTENQLQFRDNAGEGQNGLPPGTLVHEASMVAANDKEVCFNVKLRTPRRDLSTPKGWRVFIRGKPTFEDMSVTVKAVSPVTEEVVAGSVLLSSQSNQQVCDNTGYCYNKTVTTSVRVPQDVKVYSGGGSVCFGNAGHMNKVTEELTLHFDDPNPPAAGMWTGLMGRVAFRWKFN
jgi:hypothetical protein